MKVAVRGLRPDVYHPDLDCGRIKKPEGYRTVDVEEAEDGGARECRLCAGETFDHAPGPSPARKARNETTCLSCGSDIEPGGTCDFCERFEAVIGHV